MRTFADERGRVWIATVDERHGPDYKGRYHFRLILEGGDTSDAVDLLDIRWNSRRTAARTLETMSEVELQRRLRQAVGRGRKGLEALVPNGEK